MLFEINFILNFIGYFCLFLMSCYIGKLYMNLKASDFKLKNTLLLAFITCSLWITFMALVNVYLPSRPLANLSYVLWGLANGSLHYLILSLLDLIFPEEYRFIIFAEMISEYRLSTFLMANLMATIIRRMANIKSLSIIYTMKCIYGYLFLSCFVISIFFLRSHFRKLEGTKMNK